jgi:hypothetical protein
MTLLLPGSQQGSGTILRNGSIAQQAFVAATRAYLTGSAIKAPPAQSCAGASR